MCPDVLFIRDNTLQKCIISLLWFNQLKHALSSSCGSISCFVFSAYCGSIRKSFIAFYFHYVFSSYIVFQLGFTMSFLLIVCQLDFTQFVLFYLSQSFTPVCVRCISFSVVNCDAIVIHSCLCQVQYILKYQKGSLDIIRQMYSLLIVSQLEIPSESHSERFYFSLNRIIPKST